MCVYLKIRRCVMKKGKLIVLDGLDGCGKSTQLDLAASFLSEAGVKCRAISFPNYATISGQLVECYLNGIIPCEGRNGGYSASTLYAVDRYVSYVTDWKEFYESGGTIIAGRYTTSNAIYQLSKMPPREYGDYLNWLFDFEYNKLGLPEPDAVIFLDMPTEVSQRLLNARYNGDESKKDIHESNIEFLNKCRECALYCANIYSWIVVNCSENGLPLPIEDIYLKICEHLRTILNV